MATNNVKLEIGKMTPEEIRSLKDQKIAEERAVGSELVNLGIYVQAANDAEMAKTIFDIYVNAGFTKAQAASILSCVMRDYVEMSRRMRQ